jgi:hypothetical protein
MGRLARILRFGSFPETRRAILAAARSSTVRDVVRRARADPSTLLRDARDPANARVFARRIASHPAAKELASASLLLLPVRYVPLGWIASRVARKVLRRM